MSATANYGWTKPTPAGSSGTWDTILNTAIDAIDADLKLVDTAAALAKTENITFPLISAGIHAVHLGDDPVSNTAPVFFRIPGGLFFESLTSVTSHNLVIPIAGLVAGMRITGFKSRGQQPTGTTITVGLGYVSNVGVATVVSSGHSHGTSEATLTLSGLSHTVVADREYYFTLAMARASGNNDPFLAWVQPVVSR